jgi:hypothetical protein
MWRTEHIAPKINDIQECQKAWYRRKTQLDSLFAFHYLFVQKLTFSITELIPEWQRQALEANVDEVSADKWVHSKMRRWLKMTFFEHENLGAFPDISLQELIRQIYLQEAAYKAHKAREEKELAET